MPQSGAGPVLLQQYAGGRVAVLQSLRRALYDNQPEHCGAQSGFYNAGSTGWKRLARQQLPAACGGAAVEAAVGAAY